MPTSGPALPFAIFLIALGVYAIVGLLFAAAYLISAAPRLDPALRSSPLALRVLLLPGATALWPILAAKWIQSRRAGEPKE